MIFLGNDWAEDHHDVYLCNEQGERLAAARLPHGIEGLADLHALLARHAHDPSQVVVGIETDRGLWVTGLLAAGYTVYAINPRAASRYRDRHTLSGAKSDAADAKLLAEIVRIDRHNHRVVAGDSDLAEAVRVLARAHQTLIWDRTRHTNRLRDTLLAFYPAAVTTFDDLSHPDALAVLRLAPDPDRGRALQKRQILAALRRDRRVLQRASRGPPRAPLCRGRRLQRRAGHALELRLARGGALGLDKVYQQNAVARQWAQRVEQRVQLRRVQCEQLAHG